MKDKMRTESVAYPATVRLHPPDLPAVRERFRRKVDAKLSLLALASDDGQTICERILAGVARPRS